MAVATGLRFALGGLLGDRLLFVTYFPAVMIAAVWGRWLGGLTCLTVSALLAILLFRGSAPLTFMGVSPVLSFIVAGGMMTILGATFAGAVRELRRGKSRVEDAEAQLRVLVSEMGHRAKNGFAIVTAIAHQSSRNAVSVEDYRDRLVARYEAMSRAQDLVTATPEGESVDLRGLITAILAPFDLERFDFRNSSPPVMISREAALAVSLVLHELATNAVKYGAFSVEAGRIEIDWSLATPHAMITWSEVGGPPITAPAGQGFGTRLFATALRQQGGEMELKLPPDGARGCIKVLTRPVDEPRLSPMRSSD